MEKKDIFKKWNILAKYLLLNLPQTKIWLAYFQICKILDDTYLHTLNKNAIYF